MSKRSNVRRSTPRKPSAAVRWTSRLGIAVLAPLIVLGVVEGVLRVVGFGHPTAYLVPGKVEGRSRLIDNPHFGDLFFPEGMLRQPPPTVVRREKAAGTTRILVFGESAAMGDPQPAFGVARYLEVLLRQRYPAGGFEVIPLAMTAVNSHALLPIARQATSLDADYWILFVGNNEMLGPYGAGTALGAQAPPAWLVRASLWTKRQRLGQALEALWHRFRGGAQGATRWEGLKLFADQFVPEGSPQRERVYSNFRRNLRAMVHAGRRVGARVLVSSVAVNLRDCAPFGHRPPASSTVPADAASFEALLRQAKLRLDQGDVPGAMPVLDEAGKIDAADADLEFLLGRATLALTNRMEAIAHFSRARDLDTVPLRADGRLNEISQAVARENGAAWCDAASAMASRTPAGVPGNEFFYEHVHLTPLGNYELARIFAEAMTPDLGAETRKGATVGWMSSTECDRRLALSPWNRGDAAELMVQRCSDAPFTQQLNHADHLESLRQMMARLHREETAAAATQAREAYTNAIAIAPDDHHLRRSYAEFLDETGDREAAIVQWRRLTELLPQNFRGWYQVGSDLLRAGRPKEALPDLRRLVRIQPVWPNGHVTLAIALLNASDASGALEECDTAIRLEPRYAAAYRYRADALAVLSRRPEALKSLQEAVRIDPGYAEARYLLGVEYAVLNRIDEARAQFAEVIRLQPGNVRAHFNLGVALAREAQMSEAAAQFEETLRLDPSHAEAKTMLSKIRALEARARNPKPDPSTPSTKSTLTLPATH